MINLITGELLDRYRSGGCSPAERTLVESWYASYESRAPLFENEQCEEAKRMQQESKAYLMELLRRNEEK